MGLGSALLAVRTQRGIPELHLPVAARAVAYCAVPCHAVPQEGKALLQDLHVTDSSEAILSGRKPPFRLLVRAIQPPGYNLNIRHAVSEGFVVRACVRVNVGSCAHRVRPWCGRERPAAGWRGLEACGVWGWAARWAEQWDGAGAVRLFRQRRRRAALGVGGAQWVRLRRRRLPGGMGVVRCAKRALARRMPLRGPYADALGQQAVRGERPWGLGPLGPARSGL